jgi:regulator of protease activity HflC (stomatin/prohibitin superfamily)
MPAETIILIGLIILVVIVLLKSARVVPQKTVFIVERLGKYHSTLEAGFHILIPFIDRIPYKHSLKENAIDVPSQSCITKDNIQVEVDGILYFQIMDPVKTSYGVNDYGFASIQLA